MFEQAFVWMLLRACNAHDDDMELQDALAGVVPNGFVFPKSVRGKIVKITGASPVPEVGDGSKMDDWRAMSSMSTIWYGFHQNAGMDLMVRTTDGTVIGVQAKSGKVDLADAVASCSLGWQYFSRKPIASKSNTFLRKPGDLRRWFLDHAPIAAGGEHLRLVFSVKGFSPSAVDAANAYNELYPQSAILLCQSSDAVLGPLHGALAGLTDVTTVDFDPSSAAAALMVHQDVGGKNGLQGAGQSFSEWLAEEKKGRR